MDRLPGYTYGTLNGLDGRDLQFLWGFRKQSRTSTDRYGGAKLLFFLGILNQLEHFKWILSFVFRGLEFRKVY